LLILPERLYAIAVPMEDGVYVAWTEERIDRRITRAELLWGAAPEEAFALLIGPYLPPVVNARDNLIRALGAKVHPPQLENSLGPALFASLVARRLRLQGRR